MSACLCLLFRCSNVQAPYTLSYGLRLPTAVRPTEAGPLVPCSFVGTTSRSRAAERRLALRQTLGAEVSAQCKLKVRSKSDELEAHSDPETAELSRQTSAGDASQPP